MTKYIFVTGGVVSGLGKGITAASLGRLLKTRGLKVAAQKLDPYINVDPGTMSPYQHGEVFVTEDGAETDLDLGHYERFIDEDLNQYSNLTTGKVYWNVLTKERNGAYLGQTVQAIPHITNEIKGFIYSVGQKTKADVIITEIGGTTGDIESQPFLEAIRQVSLEVGRENCLFIHVTLVPYIASSGEYKSKPTQHSVKELRSMGIAPDMIVPRCDAPITEEIRHKIALFCNVKPDCVIENLTVPVLYEAPNMLEKSHFSDIVCRELNLSCPPADLSEWNEMLLRIKHAKRRVRIALVGKYVQLHDAYLSVAEALRHGGYENGVDVDIQWVDAEQVTPDTAGELLGVIMPCQSSRNYGEDREDGLALAAQYGIETKLVDLTQVKQAELSALEAAGSLSPAASANIAPRLRMTTLYAIGQSRGYLVAGTGNASERYMGYFTKWGDGAFDFNPIADLTVTEIYEFLRYLGAPSRIIEKAPSAGLYEGQTDEQELGITYQAIDRYLMEGSAGPLEMEKIQRAHSRSMHKLAEANIYKEE